jgi:putative FmdB family regulatory protein
MPTYEYACKTCGNRFETWQKFTDQPLTECPQCHGQIRRVLFPAGIVFKGSGFYSTDTRAAAAGTADSTGKAESDAKAESTSESTSESTTSESTTSESSASSTASEAKARKATASEAKASEAKAS